MADITYELLKDKSAFKHLPILTLDPRWYQLVPAVSKTDEIKYWERQVNQLLKKQGQINNDLKEVKKIKARLIQDVVDNMEEGEQNAGQNAKQNAKRLALHRKKMNQNQRLIYEAKDKISQLEDESEELPKQLAQANQHLLVETVRMCYAKINSNNADLEILDEWIHATRQKLKKNLLIKQDKENMNNQLYSGMHNLLGAEVMGALDRIHDDN